MKRTPVRAGCMNQPVSTFLAYAPHTGATGSKVLLPCPTNNVITPEDSRTKGNMLITEYGPNR